MECNRFVMVRRAALADIPELLVLLGQLYELEEDYHFDIAKHTRGFELLIPKDNAIVLVAEYQGKVVGMCSVQTVISTAQGTASGWVEDVIVLKEYRKQGIGIRLMEALDQWAVENGVSRLQLLADIDNQSAMRFYQLNGWNLMHSVAMRKYLPDEK